MYVYIYIYPEATINPEMSCGYNNKFEQCQPEEVAQRFFASCYFPPRLMFSTICDRKRLLKTFNPHAAMRLGLSATRRRL